MPTVYETGSPSLVAPSYWWYVARARLLETAAGDYSAGCRRVLDVGSADGPSVSWLGAVDFKVNLDIDPRGLEWGGVCGSATQLPFGPETFDLVSAFDVIEHCESESDALTEIHRVLQPGGIFLMSVPAYQWAWTSFDDYNHHYRRYTRRRAVAALEDAGFTVLRASYLFSSTFPMFAVNRLAQRLMGFRRQAATRGPETVPPLPNVGKTLGSVLLGLTRLEEKALESVNLPFGSSVAVVARRASE